MCCREHADEVEQRKVGEMRTRAYGKKAVVRMQPEPHEGARRRGEQLCVGE